jgi:hypothetical protein
VENRRTRKSAHGPRGANSSTTRTDDRIDVRKAVAFGETGGRRRLEGSVDDQRPRLVCEEERPGPLTMILRARAD